MSKWRGFYVTKENSTTKVFSFSALRGKATQNTTSGDEQWEIIKEQHEKQGYKLEVIGDIEFLRTDYQKEKIFKNKVHGTYLIVGDGLYNNYVITIANKEINSTGFDRLEDCFKYVYGIV